MIEKRFANILSSFGHKMAWASLNYLTARMIRPNEISSLTNRLNRIAEDRDR